MSIAEDFG